jgi:hypothetical protein
MNVRKPSLYSSWEPTQERFVQNARSLATVRPQTFWQKLAALWNWTV